MSELSEIRAELRAATAELNRTDKGSIRYRLEQYHKLIDIIDQMRLPGESSVDCLNRVRFERQATVRQANQAEQALAKQEMWDLLFPANIPGGWFRPSGDTWRINVTKAREAAGLPPLPSRWADPPTETEQMLADEGEWGMKHLARLRSLGTDRIDL